MIQSWLVIGTEQSLKHPTVLGITWPEPQNKVEIDFKLHYHTAFNSINRIQKGVYKTSKSLQSHGRGVLGKHHVSHYPHLCITISPLLNVGLSCCWNSLRFLHIFKCDGTWLVLRYMRLLFLILAWTGLELSQNGYQPWHHPLLHEPPL